MTQYILFINFANKHIIRKKLIRNHSLIFVLWNLQKWNRNGKKVRKKCNITGRFHFLLHNSSLQFSFTRLVYYIFFVFFFFSFPAESMMCFLSPRSFAKHLYFLKAGLTIMSDLHPILRQLLAFFFFLSVSIVCLLFR